ncbi:hypothetical protein OG948_14845 [Embleya sp. NBC_00888]|uniref:hypothetical protein n=1 Tax=Embleya sp. NBC_00888 TaxID=2975960 RepID=UPI00386C1941|nr:hypothetical protein OG948_14845 [Embleya sp. NBC_00888]
MSESGESFNERIRKRWSRRAADRQDGTFGPVPSDMGAGGTPPSSDQGTPAGRARLLYERATEAYRDGDVAMVEQLADLIPEGPESEPYRTFARVQALEAHADDAAAAAVARAYLDRIGPSHPAWDTARALFGEVMVQALIMGTVPLADNLAAAEEALRKPGDSYLHPSGATIRLESEDDEPLLMVLHGNAPKAVRAAKRLVATEKRSSRAGHADALCTFALCVCAEGDIVAAREALAEAERILPGRPRIGATRTRVESSPAATMRIEDR